MAGNLPLANAVSVRLIWTLNGNDEAVTVLHFANNPPVAVNQALADGLFTTIKTQFTGQMAAMIHTTVALGSLFLRDMTSNASVEIKATGAAVAGTATGTLMARNVSLCITHRTGSRGKSFRGRTYLWGYNTDQVAADGSIVSAAQSNSAAFMNLVRTNVLTTHQLQFGIVSRFTKPPGATASIERNPPIITAVTVSECRDAVWDTQRRRSLPGI